MVANNHKVAQAEIPAALQLVVKEKNRSSTISEFHCLGPVVEISQQSVQSIMDMALLSDVLDEHTTAEILDSLRVFFRQMRSDEIGVILIKGSG